MDQRMNRTSEFQVSAETNGQVIQVSFQGTDSQQIGKRLGRMLMSAVACVDDRNG